MTRAWRTDRRLPGAPGQAQQALSQFPLRVACPEPRICCTSERTRNCSRSSPPGARRAFTPVRAGRGARLRSVLDRLAEEAVLVEAGSDVSGLNRPQNEIQVGPARSLTGLPVRLRGAGPGTEAFVTLGVTDDPKRHSADGATLLGRSLEEYLRDYAPRPPRCGRTWVSESVHSERAPLPGGEAGTVAQSMPWLPDAGNLHLGQRVDRWRRCRRVSMAEANRYFDSRRWWRPAD